MKNDSVGSQRIARLFDADTFVELGAYRKRPDGTKTSAVCGYGAVNGRLVYAFSQESDCQKGAFDALQAEKIADLYALALKNGAPVVGIFDSAGAYVADGASALSAFGKLLASVSRASGAIPQIALISGTCAGLSATAAAMFDLTVLIEGKSQLFVNAPFVVGKEVGTAEYAREKGLSSVTVADEDTAYATLRSLIDFLPANAGEGVTAADCTDDVNRIVFTYDVNSLADNEKLLEIGEGYANEMRLYFARFGGVPCGIVANDHAVNGGVITAEAAKKAARFVGFCDSFGLPVITLINSDGVAVSSAEEGAPLAAALGKLAMTYANATTAKITAVMDKAYGAAFTLMGSKALGADVVYALPCVEISIMAPESAVAFLWNDKITETVSRADLVRKWKFECASPKAAAADGSIDDVIDHAELRQRICAAVYMLLEKGNGDADRLHCNLPL